MSFDLLVLILTTVGLVISPTRSSLWHLVFRQGVIFFLVAFIANMLPTVFLVLKLNGMYFFYDFVTSVVVYGPPIHHLHIEMMNVMFTISAAVASSIVACRSFVSLTNFRQRDRYVYSSTPCPVTGTRPGGSSDITQVHPSEDGTCASNGNRAGRRGLGNTIAGITFRIGAGIDSMGQVYSVDDVNTATRPISALAATGSKPGCGFGDVNEKVDAAVHVETTTHSNDDVQSEDHVIVVGWESVESLSHGHRQKIFAPDV